jgi:hypothetical protein
LEIHTPISQTEKLPTRKEKRVKRKERKKERERERERERKENAILQ